MPTIANAVLLESTKTNINHHAKADLIDSNLHYPKGFRSAEEGTFLMKDESNNIRYQALPMLPSALDYKTSTSADPASPSDGDVYLLDDSSSTYTISSIAWQSGNTVRYSFSGTPNLSAITTSFALVCSGATSSQNNGAFVITSVNDGSDFIEVTNTLITDATYDQAGAGGTVKLPHGDWNGATNGDWVRWSATDSVWYNITPIAGQQCYDIALGGVRTYNGTKWLGRQEVIQLAVSDETTSLTTGTAKITFRMPFKMYLTAVRSSLTTAGTTSGLTTIDINEAGATILSTKLSIDYTEKTSTTAATPAVISDNILADDAEITIDIDAISGGAVEKGLKVTLIGNRI